ncbi:TrmB family transcriptional regulator [Salinarchaeum sp. Harcht-Bsk1]|uniref:TrmB family transcriptional regulator n=1 Tax=Salinarchaeum sp. Harcht-Bsk1 TaxID=1333523 RepID=UPI0003422DF2|nr:TrmB family transcriptional regulator sugar-binding domain-containing protein [Salinarchaeum sp. Harcht-Bsk1]AGN01628.1 TrmB family transcriptional regulator [Salinarchaeum sp. Harcht-Bsk1]
MASDRLRDALADLGLSRTEIDAYLVVLEGGEATMRTVSERADVSQSYVYEIAGELADRGLITVDESVTPTMLRARPPAEAVEALSTRLSAFERAASERYAATGTEDAGFETIRSARTVRRRIERQIERAEEELYLVLPASELGNLRDLLIEARARGVTVYCMLTAPEPDTAFEGNRPATDWATVVRTWDGTPPMLVLRDGSGGVMGAHGLLTPGSDELDHAVAFGQPEVAGAFYGSSLGNVWPMGNQRAVAEPPALPARFDFFRSGVTAAAIHWQAGTELLADVVVVDGDGGGQRELTDVPVIGVRQSMVEPTEAAFPVESALQLATDEGDISVGGLSGGFGAYHEPFAANAVTLRRADASR